MEKICYDGSTYIWKTKLGLTNNKSKILSEANYVINNVKGALDAYTYIYEDVYDSDFDLLNAKTEKLLHKICNIGATFCKEIYTKNHNKITIGAWINVVRSKNPLQIYFREEGRDKYHVHTEINAMYDMYEPKFTFVYYIQMPNIMNNDDGVLYILGENNKEYWIRPEEDDLIIMPGELPHSPNNAPSADIDRIVLAGNIGFDYIKKTKTLF